MGNPSPGYDPAYQQQPQFPQQGQPQQGQYPQGGQYPQQGQPAYPAQPAEPYGQPVAPQSTYPATAQPAYGQSQQPYQAQPVAPQAPQSVPPQPAYGQPPAPFAVPRVKPARPGPVSMAMIMAFVVAGTELVNLVLNILGRFVFGDDRMFSQSHGMGIAFEILGYLVVLASIVLLVLGGAQMSSGKDAGRVLAVAAAGFVLFANVSIFVGKVSWMIEREFDLIVPWYLRFVLNLVGAVLSAMVVFPLAGRPASRWFAEKTLAK